MIRFVTCFPISPSCNTGDKHAGGTLPFQDQRPNPVSTSSLWAPWWHDLSSRASGQRGQNSYSISSFLSNVQIFQAKTGCDFSLLDLRSDPNHGRKVVGRPISHTACHQSDHRVLFSTAARMVETELISSKLRHPAIWGGPLSLEDHSRTDTALGQLWLGLTMWESYSI